MQTLGLDEDNPIESRKRFWARQFQDDATDSQKSFDWAFGVVLPLICFYFDPFVFQTHIGGSAVLEAYRPIAYLLGFASIMGMVAWLLWRES